MNNSLPQTVSPAHAVLLASTSISVLAYEILLMRLLSISQWQHYAYMVISMALMGFGASGSFLFLLFGRIKKNPDAWLIPLSWLTALSYLITFSFSQKLGLDPLQLIWQPAQWVKMLLTYLITALPFLFAGGIIGIILTGARKKVHRMYAIDLIGAGAGALGIMPALYWGPPWRLLPILGTLIIAGSFWCVLKMKQRGLGIITTVLVLALLFSSDIVMPPAPVIHESKDLPGILAFPDAQIEFENHSPLGMVQVVDSSLVRHVPGLSLNFGLNTDNGNSDLPRQKALLIDADGLSPITSFQGNTNELAHLSYTSMALPFHIRQPKNLLIIGSGGGTDILLGLFKHVPEIIALESNSQILDLLQNRYADFSGNLHSRPGIKLINRQARQFLAATDNHFDLIQISLTDSFGNSAGGLQSSSESYLYTVEAFTQYLDCLSDSGLLAITRWIKLPPRDSLKTVLTAVTALRKKGHSNDPGRNLLLIRSWKTFTLVISKKPFTSDQIDAARNFCNEMSYDIVYYHGMREDQANRYDVLDSPDYYRSVKTLLSNDGDDFQKKYTFNISPATDNRPYFSHFFRWDMALVLFKNLQKELFPMIEIGYLIIFATLIQAIFTGSIFILVPLLLLRWFRNNAEISREPLVSSKIISMISYFFCVGMAFMFLEMTFISKFTLLLSHPVYSVSVILATVLVFAGWGSLWTRASSKVSRKTLWISVLAITGWVIIDYTAGDHLYGLILGFEFSYRLIFTIIFVSIPSFFMGWPFPWGLRLAATHFPTHLPWAWGINGCASVIGAVLGKCLAINFGFRSVMLFACLLYLIAFSNSYILCKTDLKNGYDHKMEPHG